MRIARLDAFVKGWFLGDFEPTLFPSREFEVAIKRYRAGDFEECHHHRIATEYTVVISGRVRMKGIELGPDDIGVIEPGESTGFLAMEDSVTLVVKMPSARGDKYVD